MKKFLLFTAIHLSLISSVSFAADSTVVMEQCQKISKGIEYYSKLQKAGGSISQMERWQKALDKRESKYDNLDCDSLSTGLSANNQSKTKSSKLLSLAR